MEPRLWKLNDILAGDAAGSADANVGADAVRVLLHPGETALPLADVLGNSQAQRVVLAIGPEGGWLDNEIEFLEKEGFVRATMGRRILTSEVAVTVSITVVHQHLARIHQIDPVNPCDAVLLRTSSS